MQVRGYGSGAVWSYHDLPFGYVHDTEDVPEQAFGLAIQHLKQYLIDSVPKTIEDFSESNLNRLRIKRMEDILTRYGRDTGQSDESDEIQVSDLLADLLHFCHATGVGFDTCLERAERHFEEEDS